MLTILRRHAFTALVLFLFVVAEIAVAGGSSEGSAAVLYLFPLLWTLPLLLYRRAPEVAVLTVIGSIALEAYLAQDGTESIAVLPVVLIAFWVAGTIESEARSIAVGLVAFVLGVIVVAKDPVRSTRATPSSSRSRAPARTRSASRRGRATGASARSRAASSPTPARPSPTSGRASRASSTTSSGTR